MADPTSPLRLGILAALEAGGGPGAPVFDRVPDNSPPPAVIIDAMQLEATGAKDGGARPASFEIITVYQGRSKLAAEAIMAGVFDRLEGVSITVAGFSVTRPALQTSNLDIQEDGLTHVGRQFFRLIIL